VRLACPASMLLTSSEESILVDRLSVKIGVVW
jgi:hypothetical protein